MGRSSTRISKSRNSLAMAIETTPEPSASKKNGGKRKAKEPTTEDASPTMSEKENTGAKQPSETEEQPSSTVKSSKKAKGAKRAKSTPAKEEDAAPSATDLQEQLTALQAQFEELKHIRETKAEEACRSARTLQKETMATYDEEIKALKKENDKLREDCRAVETKWRDNAPVVTEAKVEAEAKGTPAPISNDAAVRLSLFESMTGVSLTVAEGEEGKTKLNMRSTDESDQDWEFELSYEGALMSETIISCNSVGKDHNFHRDCLNEDIEFPTSAAPTFLSKLIKETQN